MADGGATFPFFGLPVGVLLVTAAAILAALMLWWLEGRKLLPRGLAVLLLLVVLIVMLGGLPQQLERQGASLAATSREQAAQHARVVRLMLMQRDGELTSAATLREGPLICVEYGGADLPDSTCDRLVFQNSASVQAAYEQVAARIQLLRDALEALKLDPQIEMLVARLRRPLERDRFGIVAQVLEEQSGCKLEACPALSLFADPNQILAHLKARTFAKNSTRPAGTMPAAAEAPAPAAGGLPPRGNALPTDYPLPGPESIPAVNIMAPEPVPAPPKPKAVKEPPRAKPAPKAKPASAPLPIQPQQPASEPD